jgi:hypothetical protein
LETQAVVGKTRLGGFFYPHLQEVWKGFKMTLIEACLFMIGMAVLAQFVSMKYGDEKGDVHFTIPIPKFLARRFKRQQ